MKRGKEKKKEMITKRKNWKILLKWMRINMKMKMMVSGSNERKIKEETNGTLMDSSSSSQSCPTPCNPTDCSPPGSSVHGVLQARISWSGLSCPPGDLPNLGTKPGSPALQVDSSLSEPPGKPLASG